MTASLKIKLHGLKCLLVVYVFLSCLSTATRGIGTGGCNFRCPFCHNGGLVLAPLSQELYSEKEILEFLKKRKRVLKGVCITGGEPTLHAELQEFILKIRNLGYRVKLDTNGYTPEVLKGILDNKLLDYVAMDIKNCLDKYAETVGIDDFQIERIEQSVSVLKESGISYEFRTTVIKEFHAKEDLVKIADWIKGCPCYFLQQYQDSDNMLCRIACKGAGEGFMDEKFYHGYTGEEMKQMAEALRQVPGMSGEVSLRGII